MKEQIHTIPISDAFDNAGECPFCYIEKRTEDHSWILYLVMVPLTWRLTYAI